MADKYVLRLVNVDVMRVDFNNHTYEVLESELLPPSLRCITDKFRMFDMLRDWLADRVLPMSRSNVKQLCTLFNIPQTNRISSRVDIALACKAVTVNDCYWIVEEEESNLTWSDVDIRKHKLIDVLNVALLGESPTFRMKELHPDRTTDGAFPKGWTIMDNRLVLVKGDNANGFNVKAEVTCSILCNLIGIPHVEYHLHEVSGQTFSVCELMNKSDAVSYVTAQDMIDFCNNSGISYDSLINTYINEFADMVVMDYLTANADRHTSNYMFVMDNKTGYVIGFGELYDFNQAFIADTLHNSVDDLISPTLPSVDITMLEMARAYYEHSVFYREHDRVFSILQNACENVENIDKVLERYRRLTGGE